MKIYRLLLLITILFLIIETGCKNNDSGKASETDTNNDTSVLNLVDTQNVQIFVLPTPIQIAAVLKNSELTFRETNLVRPKEDFGILTSGQTALLLGAITVDAGYCALFEENQSSLKYGNSISKLISSLQINSIETDNLLKRFEANAQKSDSLASIIMQAYQLAHNYFRENNQEELGLQIISGSFFESLYLACENFSSKNYKTLAPYISQQKQYADNIFNLLSYYSKNKESAKIIDQLLKVQECLSNIKVEFDNDQFTTTLNEKQVEKLKETVKATRKELLGA